MEGTLNSSNSKSAVNPYFQRELPESAPTHIRNNLARHLGCRKVSNQQWSAYLDLIRLSGLFGFFSQSEQKSEKSSIRTANNLDMIFRIPRIKQDGGFFFRLPSAFYSLLEELVKEIQKQRKTS